MNHMGTIGEESFASMFMRLFADFKVIKLSPCEDSEEKRLQVCQPEKDTDLLKDIQQNSDPSEPILKLEGPRAKLQKAVRSMLFPGQKKKNEKILLIGRDILNDFPWAIRIVVVPLPVLDREQDMKWFLKADFIVLHDPEREKNKDFIFVLKTIRPDISIFTEKLQAELSEGIKKSFEAIFADYLVKRKRIKERLEKQQPGQLISCAQARRIAGELGVSSHLVGSVCDEFGYMVTQCSLGCF
jgi:hypothetical protein